MTSTTNYRLTLNKIINLGMPNTDVCFPRKCQLSTLGQHGQNVFGRTNTQLSSLNLSTTLSYIEQIY